MGQVSRIICKGTMLMPEGGLVPLRAENNPTYIACLACLNNPLSSGTALLQAL